MDQIGDNPKHSILDPRLYNIVNLQTNSLKVDEDLDRQFIDKWLTEKGKFRLNSYFPIRKSKCEITISGAKHALKNCFEIIEKLSKTQEELRNHVSTMSSQEWKQKTLDIGNLKDEFDKTMMSFEDNTVLRSLKGMIVKRSKKRINQKKRKVIQQESHLIKKEQEKELHKTIDRWLENKKDEVERVKMEEKMKKNADCVLYEVTKKKSEARKQLSLISALVKLRTVRDNMAVQRGDRLSLEDRKAFGLVTEKLVRMWESAYQNYCKEEQCLKIMLEHDAMADTQTAIATRRRRVMEDWEVVISGKKDVPTNNPTYWALTSANRDLESFIAIRKSWDTFLTNPENDSGSAIPLGWVVPPATPSDSWVPYLTNFVNLQS